MVNCRMQWWEQTRASADQVSNRGVRLWDEREYFATASPERLRSYCRPRIDNRRRSAGAESGWNFSFQRSRRSGRIAICAQGSARFDRQETDFRYLSRPSNSRVRVWRIDIQIEIWSSRRESASKRF